MLLIKLNVVFGLVYFISVWIFTAVCDVRLDFEQFTTNAPASTEEDGGLGDPDMTPAGGICQDILTISTNTGQAIPEICGMNTGQHGKDNLFLV